MATIGGTSSACKIDPQTSLYNRFNKFSSKHSILGRFFAVPVCVIDLGLEIFRDLHNGFDCLVEGTAELVFNFFKGLSAIKNGLLLLKQSCKEFLGVAITLNCAPLCFAVQLIACLYDPTHVTSFHHFVN